MHSRTLFKIRKIRLLIWADFFNYTFTIFYTNGWHRTFERRENQSMEAWFAENWGKILLSIVTSGALGVCGWLWKQLKNYKKLLNKEEAQ
jgi:hypothetical protein